MQAAADRLKAPPHPIPAFHWEIEFPEVFARENGGFDAFVGNPPFAGKNTLLHGSRDGYLDWLKAIHEGSHGNSDLVAHFFRRCFLLNRKNGTAGLIATNTIGQGDTRATGLQFIRENGGSIFSATRRKVWPGQAAVVVSVVHTLRNENAQSYILDGKFVPNITSFLFHTGPDSDPRVLNTNLGKSFVGCCVLGMGFTFDDQAQSDSSNSIADMEALVAKDPRNSERIFPYIGGQEVNEIPNLKPDRFVINFDEMSKDEARRYPDLMAVVESKVRPEREKQKDKGAKEKWWLFLRPRPELHRAIKGLERVIVVARVSQSCAFTFLPTGIVYSEQLVVVADNALSHFAVLQSRIHECWARFFGSSMKDDLRYTASDCYDTFPFPIENERELNDAGQNYFASRHAHKMQLTEGLTKTYNRFHDPHEQSEGILELRRLHGLMDGAVLRAYGWDDLAESARCEFLLDYEEGDGDSGLGVGDENESITPKPQSRRKLPWRLRWPDEFRDEVLARLLELNEQRHKEELLAASVQSLEKKEGKETKKRKTKNKVSSAQQELDLDGGDG